MMERRPGRLSRVAALGSSVQLLRVSRFVWPFHERISPPRGRVGMARDGSPICERGLFVQGSPAACARVVCRLLLLFAVFMHASRVNLEAWLFLIHPCTREACSLVVAAIEYCTPPTRPLPLSLGKPSYVRHEPYRAFPYLRVLLPATPTRALSNRIFCAGHEMRRRQQERHPRAKNVQGQGGWRAPAARLDTNRQTREVCMTDATCM